MEHNLKCWPDYFRAVKYNIKPFEIRRWDRPYKTGDMLILREYDPTKEEYTGYSVVREITYLLPLSDIPGIDLENKYVALGLKKIKGRY